MKPYQLNPYLPRDQGIFVPAGKYGSHTYPDLVVGLHKLSSKTRDVRDLFNEAGVTFLRDTAKEKISGRSYIGNIDQKVLLLLDVQENMHTYQKGIF